jgi:hypothetical protein
MYSDMLLYGPVGYGRSHLLATVAYLLIAKGRRVVYIPDCGLLERDPFTYVQTAMLLAWADDPIKLRQICSLRSDSDIGEFFRLNGRDVLFIIDQLEVLDKPDVVAATTTTKLRTWLESCRYRSHALLCSSVNNMPRLREPHRSGCLHIYRLDGGLTRVSEHKLSANFLPRHFYIFRIEMVLTHSLSSGGDGCMVVNTLQHKHGGIHPG